MIHDIYTIQHVTLIQKGDGKRSNRDQSLTKKFDIFSPCVIVWRWEFGKADEIFCCFANFDLQIVWITKMIFGV